MACDACFSTVFKQKIGRCKRCMVQLTLLSAVSWPLWYWLYFEDIRSVESIALLFFAFAFSGLLLLHLMVLSYRTLRDKLTR
ncbi:DUF3624 domain-containing protein [Shewanella gelidii]|uniref:DUF3624 domain-containing protein n=1 Tax=Shewanella gelidii TaxID=1642821 RepID=UPI001665A122|nr:DUF3624 domain-containing protein [Shewanella gelidii]MCL1097369.1 DUF3624 domain-containing protein [Shewanella gelidii]